VYYSTPTIKASSGMTIEDFIWLDEFVEKLETKHGVYPDEVEEVFSRQPAIQRIQKGKVQGEHLYRALGQTADGRYLTIIFVYKPTRRSVIVISARDMDQKEHKRYGRSATNR
jgi:hypothetical protein